MGARLTAVALAALLALTACGGDDPAGTSASPAPESPHPTGEEQISRADFESWPFLDLVGSGTLVCEEDGAITFTPPAGGDTYAVNKLAQEAGYSDIGGIACDPEAGGQLGCPEEPTLDPILEHGVTLCQPEVQDDAAVPAD